MYIAGVRWTFLQPAIKMIGWEYDLYPCKKQGLFHQHELWIFRETAKKIYSNIIGFFIMAKHFFCYK
jgi:hypothetical protein